MKRFEVSPFRQVSPFSFLDELWPSASINESKNLFPRMDIGEKEGLFYASVDVPGVKKEDIDIQINDNIVVVSGERKEERKAEHYSEKIYGSFKRSFQVPRGYDLDKLEAHFDNGVLNLAMPLKEEVKQNSKKIEIKDQKEGLFNKLF